MKKLGQKNYITKNLTKSKISERTWYKNKNYVFLDIETFDLDYSASNKIVQFGLYIYKNGIMQENKTISQIIDPEEQIPEESSSIHKIYDKDVKGMPTFQEFWPDIKKYFNGDYLVIAFNAGFDVPIIWINATYNDFKMAEFDYFCAKNSLKKIIGKEKLDKFSLKNICDYLNIELNNHHNALADAKAIIDIFEKLEIFVTKFIERAINEGYRVKTILKNFDC
ncbi:3'-5' exonuclease [Mycoplasma phocimorsus]|uniref:3'-5' exonuclease n=1 Tax=Mycoplasma phocimorsus TaxID=3045839 RepID=UPI0024C07CD8|nr:3'-5' exonuclease [Mycoplasma phocimorsus]MDJ1647649.1 3'-5' exonuclease [Mycoplasma phocimorsus]